ncbi:MAG: hypothetical protein ACSNEK_02100 [Parachlamydiaceae bacterium]
MKEVILIERYSPAYEWWSSIVKFNRVLNLTPEQLVKKYKGFEGSLINYFSNEEDSDQLLGFYGQYIEFQKNSPGLSLLHLFAGETAAPSLEQIATKVGYDVGFLCCKSNNIYSSIFNEILLGDQEELVAYREHLNKHLLFDAPSFADEYVVQHKWLEDKGRDVEQDPMIVYEVWEHHHF